MVGCSFLSELPKIQPQAKTTGFTVSSFTMQSMHPGVEMNLWKTVTYRIEIDALFPEGSHNFELFVTVKGIPSKDTGFVINLKELGDILKNGVIEKIDHKNINLDVDFMSGKMSSTENLVIGIWEQIEKDILKNLIRMTLN